MNDGFQMSVVVIEDVAGNAVDESRVHDVETLAAAEQGSLRRSRERRKRRYRDIDGLMMGSADGDADPVEQRAHSLFADIGGKIVVLRRDDIVRQRPGDVFRRGRSRLGGIGSRYRGLREGPFTQRGCERQCCGGAQKGSAIRMGHGVPQDFYGAVDGLFAANLRQVRRAKTGPRSSQCRAQMPD